MSTAIMEKDLLPRSQGQAKRLLNGITSRKTLHDLAEEEFESGSKITDEQFALLRVFFPQTKTRLRFKHYSTGTLKLRDARERARAILKKSVSYANSIEAIEQSADISSMNEKDEKWPGMFVPFLQFLNDIRMKATGSPTEGPSGTKRKRRASPVNYYGEGDSNSEEQEEQEEEEEEEGDQSEILFPEADGEAVVNACCLLLLKALGQLINIKRSKWTISQQTFKPEFEKGSFTAVTDGALLARDNAVQAIVEVKPRIRSAIKVPLLRQQAAEMVAWICEGDKPNALKFQGHRLLLSQTRHEIYLLFAKPTDEYVKYLKEEVDLNHNHGFLSIDTYGPWSLTDSVAMDELCEILLAVTLVAESVEDDEAANE